MTTINSNNLYLGRLGAAIDRSLFLLNDQQKSWHSCISMAMHMNRCYQSVAAAGYWQGELTLSLVAGTSTYDLRDEVPGIIAINSVRPSDTRFDLRHYTNWPDLDGRRATDPFTANPPVFGYYVQGTILKVVGPPDGNWITDLTIHYSYSPSDLGTMIVPSAVAVTNLGGGLVGITAPAHGIATLTPVTIQGTTNYNGTVILDATTSTNQIVFADTYVAETLTATANIQPVAAYTPDWPAAFDDVLEYFACREAWTRDMIRKEADPQWSKYNEMYLQAKGDLHAAYAGPGLSIQPGRGF